MVHYLDVHFLPHLQHDCKVKESSNCDTETLCGVVKIGHSRCVNSLLKTVADVNASSMEGVTPLTRAARNGDIDILTELIKSGADVNLSDVRGDTATLWLQ